LSQFTQSKDLEYKQKLAEIFQLTNQQDYIDAVTELLNIMIEENKIRNDVNKNIEELMKKQQKQEVLKMTKKISGRTIKPWERRTQSQKTRTN